MGRAGVYFPGLTARGGAERLALTLAVSLERLGWDTAVYTDVDVDTTQLATDLGRDVSVLHFVNLGSVGHEFLPVEMDRLWNTRRHVRIMRGDGLDLFVNARFKSQVPGVGRRNVYYCHFPHKLESGRFRGPRAVYMGLAKWVDRAFVTGKPSFLDTYDAVWANSLFTAGHVRDRWGVEAEILYPPCEEMPRLPKEKLIAVVGRFQARTPGAPYKAQDFLIKEFAEMPDLHAAGWEMECAGGLTEDPKDHAFFEELGSLAEGLPVVLRPNVGHDHIRQLYGRASVYWHAQGVGGDADKQPQTQEHFGITTVEAMSAGAIPVVYGTAGPHEVVAGVQGLQTWRDGEELRRLTRQHALVGADDQQLIRACQSRARNFGVEAFVERLSGLIQGPTLAREASA